VLNDAVLAAAGFPPAKHEKTVMITMGFGLGGALWEG
jgi:predicted NBD/HSP70 family sugar kinase